MWYFQRYKRSKSVRAGPGRVTPFLWWTFVIWVNTNIFCSIHYGSKMLSFRDTPCWKTYIEQELSRFREERLRSASSPRFARLRSQSAYPIKKFGRNIGKSTSKADQKWGRNESKRMSIDSQSEHFFGRQIDVEKYFFWP